jgi:transketolase
MHTIKPIDTALLAEAAAETGAVVTVEEHSVVGGLGGAVAEALGETCPVPTVRCGIPDRFGESGRYPDILARAGLDVEHVCAAAEKVIGMKAGGSKARQ